MNDISDALAEAGHPLDNSNGHIALEALRNLIAERDLFRRETVALAKDALAMKDDLDQERADNERLRAFAQDCEDILGSDDEIQMLLNEHGLTDMDGVPTAMLSGRGEGA